MVVVEKVSCRGNGNKGGVAGDIVIWQLTWEGAARISGTEDCGLEVSER